MKRLLSAYANRVLDPRWRDPNHAELCNTMEIPPDPTVGTFIKNIDSYRLIPAIKHHTRNQSYFLGSNLRYYDRVFRAERLDDAIAYIEARSGMKIDFPRLKTDGPKVSKSELSQAEINQLEELLAEDYALLSTI